MSKPLQVTFGAVLVVVALAVCLLVRETILLERALTATANKIAVASDVSLKPSLDKLNATLDAINAPCVGFHGSVTCGPLAQLSQTEKNVGILAGQAALQVRQSATLVNAASEAVTSATADVHTMAVAGTETLGEGKRTLASFQPLAASLTRTADASTLTVQHFDALVQSPDLAAAIQHANGMTASGDTILSNAAEVSTKAKQDYMKARTPWGKFVTTGLDLIHLGAYAAR